MKNVAKTLYNMASQDGGRYCPQVVLNGGLQALEVVSNKLNSTQEEKKKDTKNGKFKIKNWNVIIVSL